jgi:uncharacterized membrane protein
MRKKLTVAGVVAIVAALALQFVMRAPAPSEEPASEVPPQPALAVRADETRASQDPPVRAPSARSERAPEPAAAEVVDAPPAATDTPLAAADAALAAGDVPLAVGSGARRFMFDCGNGVTFAVRVVPGEAALFSQQALGPEAIWLPPVDDSGARYAKNGVSFSRQGGLATFEVRERTFADCTSHAGAAQTAEALRRRATFRAHGNGPSWAIAISPDGIDLSGEGGSAQFPYRAPAVAGTRTTYRSFVGTQELVVVIDALRCNDTLNGEQFDSTVTVTFEGMTLYGCGRAP